MRVFVYYNLHRKVWSVKALEGPDKGRVISHQRWVLIENAEGKVSQAGRERVLREGRKNVHAGIVGELVAVGDEALKDVQATVHNERAAYSRITYNPYKYSSFVFVTGEAPFSKSRRAYLGDRRQVFVQTR